MTITSARTRNNSGCFWCVCCCKSNRISELVGNHNNSNSYKKVLTIESAQSVLARNSSFYLTIFQILNKVVAHAIPDPMSVKFPLLDESFLTGT